MSRRTTVTLLKFVGTISLGLLTGLSTTLSTTSLPALLLLPAAPPAYTTSQHLQQLTARHQSLLASLGAGSLVLAFALSPARGRHPYLLWATLAVGAGFWREALGAVVGGRKRNGNGNGNGVAEGKRGRSAGREDSGEAGWDFGDGEAAGEVNGEAVREGVEAWRGREALRAGILAVGWVVSLVGIWGDGV